MGHLLTYLARYGDSMSPRQMQTPSARRRTPTNPLASTISFPADPCRPVCLFIALTILLNVGLSGAFGAPHGVHHSEPHAHDHRHDDDHDHDRTLIVGGTEAPNGRYPYSASLSTDGTFKTHLCGGSLIAPDIVLTAGHCAGVPGPYTRVDIDQHNLDDRDEDHEYLFVDEIVMHPDHVLLPDEFRHDFAIVKLYGEAQAPPVGLNRNPNVPRFEDEPLTVLGWGFLDDDVPSNMIKSEVMMEAEIGYVPNDVCGNLEGIDPKTQREFSYGDRYVDDDSMCAHHPDRGSCLGDSGGPLIVRGDTAEDDLLVGMVSFGLDCNHDVLPGVYARVSSEIDWITEQVCRLSSNPPADFGCDPPDSSGGIRTFVTVELKLGNWLPSSTGWLLGSADGKTVYAYRSTQTYGPEYLDQVVTEMVAVDTNQAFRFVVLHNDALGFCCEWYGQGFYNVYQGRGTSGTVLVSGKGDFDNYVREEFFTIGKPPPAQPVPTPIPPPTPAPGTPFITVVLGLEFGPQSVAWGLKSYDENREYADYRSTNTFKDMPAGTITETIHLFPADNGVDQYEFTIYNALNGWVGDYEVFLGHLDEGRILFSGDSEFDSGRVLWRHQFQLSEEDYELFGPTAPPTKTNGDGDASSSASVLPSQRALLSLLLGPPFLAWDFVFNFKSKN